MSIKNNNFLRGLFSLMLVGVILLGIPCTAHAQIGGANEIWRGEDLSGQIRMHNTNLTPVKIMGQSGNLRLWFAFAKQNSREPDIIIHVQVRNLTQHRSYNFDVRQMNGIEERQLMNQAVPVNQGDRVQIYFDICTAPNATPPGYNRSAIVQYGYYFE